MIRARTKRGELSLAQHYDIVLPAPFINEKNKRLATKPSPRSSQKASLYSASKRYHRVCVRLPESICEEKATLSAEISLLIFLLLKFDSSLHPRGETMRPRAAGHPAVSGGRRHEAPLNHCTDRPISGIAARGETVCTGNMSVSMKSNGLPAL